MSSEATAPYLGVMLNGMNEELQKVATYFNVPVEEVHNWRARGCQGLTILPFDLKKIAEWRAE